MGKAYKQKTFQKCKVGLGLLPHVRPLILGMPHPWVLPYTWIGVENLNEMQFFLEKVHVLKKTHN